MMYHLFLATPEKILFDGNVLSLVAPGELGYFEILKDHAALITSLKKGSLTITNEDKVKQQWEITGGIFEVVKNQASLLADDATCDISLK